MPSSRSARAPIPAWHQALGQASADKRLDILRLIGACGSISQAAREAGVSYKAAWQAVDTLSNLAGTPLVERAVGGSGGGGALLTPAGQSLLEGAEWMARARQEVLARLAAHASPPDGAPSLPSLGLRTSMRNQLRARVLGLSTQQGVVRVRLQIAGHAQLQARITRDSAQLLGLEAGQAVLALCKATAVHITADPKGSGLGTQPQTQRPTDPHKTSPATAGAAGQTSTNALSGTVARLPAGKGKSPAEVTLALAGGGSWVGMLGPDTKLRVGDPAIARFEDSAVVLALEA